MGILCKNWNQYFYLEIAQKTQSSQDFKLLKFINLQTDFIDIFVLLLLTYITKWQREKKYFILPHLDCVNVYNYISSIYFHSIPGQYQSTILFTLKRLFYQKWKIDLIKIIILKHIIKMIFFCILYFKRYKLYLYLSQLYINTA